MKSLSKYLIVFALLHVMSPLAAKKYYVNATSGSDNNSGYSMEDAFKSLEKVNALDLRSGDQVLLAMGMVYEGTLKLKNLSGSLESPILIGSYMARDSRSEEFALIDAKGFRNGILLENCSHIIIRDLVIKADGGGVEDGKLPKRDMRCGVFLTATEGGSYENIQIRNLLVEDIYYEDRGFVRGNDEVRTANGTQNYGWGIRVINARADAILKNVSIDSCEIRNVSHTGVKLTGKNMNILEVEISECKVFETGGPGMQMSGVEGAVVKNNDIHSSGNSSDSRKWGRGSGLWTWSCKDIIIEHNSFRNAKGPGDSAGCHIDFNCSNVIVQYNISENNAGGFCEILGNNFNCAYRYNISINDGHRVKKIDGAFQEGKIFWLSGFVGKGRKRNGPFNSYFYNNTIYVKEEINAKFAVDRASKGALLVNNIFYIEGESKLVLGDQYKPEVAGESKLKNMVFKNNLFLRDDNWPKEMMIQDENPKYGNPKFSNPGGTEMSDYIPQNKKLIKNKGIRIEPIPEDEKGVFIGLKVENDILGNKIKGLPDMGAIEMR